jgi:hypothetical protein
LVSKEVPNNIIDIAMDATEDEVAAMDFIMDAAQDLDGTLESLTVDAFKALRLTELESMLDQNPPGTCEKKQALVAYLKWLHEQLLGWDLSDPLVCHAGITSWCDSLRSRSFDDGVILASFLDWQRKQKELDPCSARRFDLAEIEVRNHLQPSQIPFSAIKMSKQDSANADGVIEVNSGSEDSDIEFLGWEDPAKKAPSKKCPKRDTNRNMERSLKSEKRETDTQSTTKARNGAPPARYLCRRCGVKGKLSYVQTWSGRTDFMPLRTLSRRLPDQCESSFRYITT